MIARRRRGKGGHEGIGLYCALATVTLGCAAMISTATAADAYELAPGQRIRITAPGLGVRDLVGELLRMDQDSLVVRSDECRAFPRTAVTRLETSSGRHGHAIRGAVIGGLVAGAFVGQDMLRKPSQCRGSGNYGQICAAVLGGSVVAGAGLGAVVGMAIRHEEWSMLLEGAGGEPRRETLPRRLSLALVLLF